MNYNKYMDIIFNQVFKFNVGNTQFNVTIDDFFITFDPIEDFTKDHLHFHTEYELFLLTNGELSLLESQGQKHFKDCIVCIPPFFAHCSLRTGKSVYRFLFSFSQKGKNTHGLNTFSFFKRFFQYGESMIFSENVAHYLSMIEGLIIKNNEPFQYEKIELLLRLLFLEFLPKSNNNDNNIVENSYLIKIDDFIYNHYNENKTLTDLAKSMNLCTKQTSRIIMKNYHKPLNQLLTERRLNIACSRLLETNKNISEIIEDLNFNSENYFFRLFKKYYGVTPLQYRKQNLPKN